MVFELYMERIHIICKEQDLLQNYIVQAVFIYTKHANIMSSFWKIYVKAGYAKVDGKILQI